jgi:hypothetical protein
VDCRGPLNYIARHTLDRRRANPQILHKRWIATSVARGTPVGRCPHHHGPAASTGAVRYWRTAREATDMRSNLPVGNA